MTGPLDRYGLGGGGLADLTRRVEAMRKGAAGTPETPPAERARDVPVHLIDEDPDQPRKHFDTDAIRSLADSIALPGVGLRQRVTVRPAGPNGRHLLVHGARRLHAVRLLGWATIPAVVEDPPPSCAEGAVFAGQVIENRQRQGHSDTELAAAVHDLAVRGYGVKQIATALALDDPQSVKHYRCLADVAAVPAMARFIDRSPARALYELHNVWKAYPGTVRQSVEDALRDLPDDGLSIMEARRIKARAASWQEHRSRLDAAPPSTQDAVETSAASSGQDRPRRAGQEQGTPREAETETQTGDGVDEEAERAREAAVRAWLRDKSRPRPPLSV